ncbi:MAG: MBOAT family protein [Flavobacteriales bacterium]|nr:MBOAT family protein [Flavobacteriales bacterium]
MLFNSLDFALFLPLVFTLYWTLSRFGTRFQNSIIVVASYVFYGWWDWRFLTLILFSTVVDYSVGILMSKETKESRRKGLLWLSILVNLGLLGFFKYSNFFIENFISAFTVFGSSISISSLNIILPVGISFYTFQTLSYSIDIYRKKLEPTKDFVSFCAFVSFFPQLVAGPIERATNLLPQFYHKRTFNYESAVNGMRQILWGLVKKMVIADNAAVLANEIFNNSESLPGSALALGAIFFTFQIYGDFSGYSDIAIGTARLFGFNLMQNFAFPYFSRDISEFWRRWHISLSTWFRDYVYIPLGGSRGSSIQNVRNVFAIFLISGFWHGANWTFIFWGGLNALYFLPLLLAKRNRIHTNHVAEGRIFATFKEIGQIVFTFSLSVFAWIFFRAENLTHAFDFISGMFSPSLFSFPPILDKNDTLICLISIGVFIIIEWLGREGQFAIDNLLNKWPRVLRYAFYYALIIGIIMLAGEEQEFIYFQF